MHRAQLIAGCDATRSDASKDFFDPVKQRRINWGWLTTTDYGVQSLPRELHYHPVLKQLTFNPVEEQDQLRVMPPLTDLSTQQLSANSSLSLDNGETATKSARSMLTVDVSSTDDDS